jgi:two-component system response regulator DevR
MVRDALALVLGQEADIEVVGSVAGSKELMELIGRLDADVAVLDVRLKDESGLDLAQRIRSSHPDTKIVMLTSFESDAALVGAYEANASAFLFKSGDSEELVRAIRDADAGLRLINPYAAKAAVQRLRSDRTTLIAQLDDTDRQILRALAAGDSDKQIAESVYLSLQTVRNRVSRLLNKFGKSNRTQLAVYIAQVFAEAD